MMSDSFTPRLGNVQGMSFAAGIAFALVCLALVRIYSSFRLLTRKHPSWKHECSQGCAIDLPDMSLMGTAQGSGADSEGIADIEATLLDRFCAIMPEYKTITEEEDWRVSAARLSKLLQEDYLRIDELHGSNAFFAAHRVLAKLRLGSLGIRMTVQYNLFAGTIGAIGSADQVEWLHRVQKAGELGCFLLTERSAGVLSGFIVETTATWVPERRVFVLSTPGATDGEGSGATKMWISQGLAARWGVCIARLVVGGVERGQQGFIVDMEMAGVHRETMAPKTSFNSLDNAYVSLLDVELPESALLSKFCRMDAAGEYISDSDNSFLLVAQRLLSGRICISDAAITYFGTVLEEAEEYCARRLVWVDKEQQMSLRALPYMQHMFTRFHSSYDMYRTFLLWLQTQYRDGIKRGQLDRASVTLIAAAKIEAVEFCINAVHLLRRNVGAYGLLADGPFGATNEILLCARFAEGDSRILQQMMVRELIRQYRTPAALAALLGRYWLGRAARLFGRGDAIQNIKLARMSLLLRLLWFLRRSVRFADGKQAANANVRAWLSSGDLVYDLAKLYAHELICESVVGNFGRSSNSERFSLSAPPWPEPPCGTHLPRSRGWVPSHPPPID